MEICWWESSFDLLCDRNEPFESSFSFRRMFVNNIGGANGLTDRWVDRVGSRGQGQGFEASPTNVRSFCSSLKLRGISMINAHEHCVCI